MDKTYYTTHNGQQYEFYMTEEPYNYIVSEIIDGFKYFVDEIFSKSRTPYGLYKSLINEGET